MNDNSDAELVRRAKRGERSAVDALFHRHWEEAWRLARSVSGSDAAAEDATQEAFIRALSELKGLRDGAAFRAWLHRIVVNKTLDGLRRETRAPVLLADARIEEGSYACGLDPALDLTAGLTPEHRVVVFLRYCLDYSLAETADLLELPVGTVQSRAARGLKELRMRMGVGRGE